MAFNKTDVYWIYLQGIIGFGSRKLLKVLDVFETAENFYKASYKDKVNSKIFDKREIERIDKFEIESAHKIIDKCDKLGYKIITPDHDLYPTRLKHIINPPSVLYVKGDLPYVDDEVAITIVGTRKACDYSRALAYELSERLTRAGALIVSGGAKGIDTSAHSGALAAKGKTIAVLGCGLNYNYLACNEMLRQDIAENGALVTEYTPDYPAYSYNFPSRNRIMSGLSLGTVVVEAGKGSGALYTVDHALEQGRDIFVIPGDLSSPRYVGSNRLIRDGAKVTTSPLDVLEEYTHLYPHRLNIEGCSEMLQGKGKYQPEVKEDIYPKESKAVKKTAAQKPKPEQKTISTEEKLTGFKMNTAVANLSENALELYLAFSKPEMLFDELVDASELSVNDALAAATELEISGVAEAIPGGRYKICL